MIIKNTLRIIRDYKFSLVKIIFFELLYFIKGYSGFKFNFSNNSTMADNIPCPYYFLLIIKKYLEKSNFIRLVDLGCGSGRVIDFFNNSFPKKKFIGIEYFFQQFEYCKNSFDKNDNVKIIQADFTKIDIMKLNSDYFFLTAPFKNTHDFLNFVERIISLSNKKIFFIIINYNKKTIEKIKNIEIIETYYISESTGYSICCSNNI